MPLYTYTCVEGHVTEHRGGYDDVKIPCPWLQGTSRQKCQLPAKRNAVYREQGVIFKGVGFTTTAIPPLPPKPETKAGEPVADWEEKLHEFADKQYQHDTNYRDESKEVAKKALKQLKRGAVP